MDALSFPLMGPAGRAVRAPDEWTMLVLVVRSSRRGRWRAVVMSGEEGSFLTTILGACGPRALESDLRLEKVSCLGGDMDIEALVEVEEEEG
jgi:hypothetical protein